MIWHTLHVNGAYTKRPGTASRVRNRFLGSAACNSRVMPGIATHLQGGAKP